jgi:hypothetical protein
MNFKKILLTFTILFISANYSYSQRATATEWKNLIYAIEEHESRHSQPPTNEFVGLP